MYKLKLNLNSFDLDSLNRTEKYLLSVFSFFDFTEIKQQIHPKKSKKITVLRSPHIDKKSREQFQIQSHKKTLSISIENKKSVLLVFEIFKNMKSPGVEIDILVDFSTES